MCSCMEEAANHADSVVVIASNWTLFITVIMTGIAGSFTHCIGMCGPIAMTQMSMRMIHMKELKPWTRIDCALATPYYLGKATTYALLALIIATLGQNILIPQNEIAISPGSDNSVLAYHYIRMFILSAVAYGFLIIGIRVLFQALRKVLVNRFDKNFHFSSDFLHYKNSNVHENISQKQKTIVTSYYKTTYNHLIYYFLCFPNLFESIANKVKKIINNILKITCIINLFQKLSKYFSKSKLQPFGLQGFMLGMILGLLPCGLVYSTVLTIISSSNGDFYLIAGYAFLFGITTIPGLFIVSYFGQYILQKWKSYFNLLYGLSMLANSLLLLSHI